MTLRSMFGYRPQAPAGAPVRVLLIDDDEEDVLITRSLLARTKDIHYVLDWAPTYTSGLADVKRGDHNAYLVDQRIGAVTGIDLVREARAAGSRAPLIMYTGQRNRTTDLAALDAGATDFLEKGKTDAALLDRTLRYAITQAQTLELLDHAHKQLEGLEELGRMLLEDGPTAQSLDRVVGVLDECFGFSHVALYLTVEDSLHLVASRGYRAPREAIDLADAAVERIIHAHRPVILPNLTLPTDDRETESDIRVELAVPLMVRGELLGLINAGSPVASPIGLEDHAAIKIVADRLTAALELMTHQQRLEEQLAHARAATAGGPAGDAVRDPGSGLYTPGFLEAFVNIQSTLRDGRPLVPDVVLIVFGPADGRAEGLTSDVLQALTSLATTAYPGQLVARNERSELVVVTVGVGRLEATRAAESITKSVPQGPEAIVAGLSSLELRDDPRALAARAETALALARRLGPGNVVG